jgi:hypothetical protein
MRSAPFSKEDRFKLRSVAFFGRTLAEYLQMFSLRVDELRGVRILDVASGPGSFVAEALAMGMDVTGCDPMYAQDADTIAARGKADIDACREQIRRNPGVLSYRNVDRFYADKYAALEKFAVELATTDYDDGCQTSGGCANQALVARRATVSPPSS